MLRGKWGTTGVLGKTWEYTETDTLTLEHTRVRAPTHTHTRTMRAYADVRVLTHTLNRLPVQGGRAPFG